MAILGTEIHSNREGTLTKAMNGKVCMYIYAHTQQIYHDDGWPLLMEWKARFLISKREFFGKQGGKVVQKVSLKSLKKSVETFLFSLSSSFLVHKAGHRLVLGR